MSYVLIFRQKNSNSVVLNYAGEASEGADAG